MNASVLGTLTVLVAVVLLAVGWQVARRPVQRRLAARDATRRKGETALVIAGSLLGTALIAGSFIVGDTLDSSVKQTAWSQLGPIDEVITVPDRQQAEQIESTIAGIEDDRIEDVMSLYVARASIASEASGETLADPDSQLIEVDFDRAQDFGGEARYTGIDGATPSGDEAIITDDLATKLEVSEGDTITAYLYGSQVELEVDRVVPQQGIAGFWTGFESRSPNAFVAPGTIDEAVGSEVAEGAVPPSTAIIVSNRGGVEEGAAVTDEVTASIDEALGDADLRIEPVKDNLLTVAEESGQMFGELFLNIGLFAIIAGVLLLVNIFVMLSEERKGQLGMLRAVGMRRSDLVRVFVIEGAIYSIIASLIGAVLGIGVGWAIVKLAAPIFSNFGDFSLDLSFAADFTSIAGGFCLGLLISMVTITFTSIRISRINIIRAIRDLPDPKVRKSRLVTVIATSLIAGLGIALFAASFGNDDAWAAGILALPIAAFCMIPLLGRLIGAHKAVIAASAFSLFWGIAGNQLTDGQFFDSGEMLGFVLQGVLLTFSAVVLLSQTQEVFESFIRRIAASKLALRLSIAYPLARRFRTGLTLGMYSLVIFTMTFIAVLSNVFGGQVDNVTKQEAGGFDIVVSANPSNPPSSEELTSVEGVDDVSPMRHGNALFTAGTTTDPAPWPATGIDSTFVDIGAPAIGEFSEEFESKDAVWEEVATNPEVTVVPSFFLQGGGGPPQKVVDLGEPITIIDPVTGAESQRTVIGFIDNDIAFSGAYMSNESLSDALGGRAPVARFYVQASGSTGEVEQTATRLQGELIQKGVEADSFRTLVEENQSVSLQFMRLMQAYLALGLVVGVAGLGVVMVRAVRDRRREIGVLRSLGFVPQMVRRAFLLESGFVALEGILIGSILALITSQQLVDNGEFGEGIEFVVPWLQILLVCGASFLASLFAAAWPSQQASKIAPAVALRIAD